MIQKRAFCSCDLDLDLDRMTLIYELGLEVLKMYVYTKNELSRSGLSKVGSITDIHTERQTDRRTDGQTPLKALLRRIRGQ